MKGFFGIIGNPPYQEEVAKKDPTNNGQKRVRSIFNDFQDEVDKITTGSSCLVYPGGRWLHQSGKGMKSFGNRQINDPRLAKVVFFKNANDVFCGVDIADGITYVLKKKNKTSQGFEYTYIDDESIVEAHVESPGDNIIPLNPNDASILDKIDKTVRGHGLNYLHPAILSQKLFKIESSFVEENPHLVRELDEAQSFDPETEVKLFTNDKAGKAGRAKWFITAKEAIPANRELIEEWQVVVSSANAGGQKRDNKIAIIDNHSAFGRSRVALRSFKTKVEAENFFKFASSYVIRYTFLMTDEALTSLGKRVPDLLNYTDEGVIDFSRDIDSQLMRLFGLSEGEMEHIERTVKDLRSNKEMS